MEQSPLCTGGVAAHGTERAPSLHTGKVLGNTGAAISTRGSALRGRALVLPRIRVCLQVLGGEHCGSVRGVWLLTVPGYFFQDGPCPLLHTCPRSFETCTPPPSRTWSKARGGVRRKGRRANCHNLERHLQYIMGSWHNRKGMLTTSGRSEAPQRSGSARLRGGELLDQPRACSIPAARLGIKGDRENRRDAARPTARDPILSTPPGTCRCRRRWSRGRTCRRCTCTPAGCPWS